MNKPSEHDRKVLTKMFLCMILDLDIYIAEGNIIKTTEDIEKYVEEFFETRCKLEYKKSI